MSKKSLDDLFRDAFDAPTEAPSNALWQRLEKRLDERRAERRKARRIRFLQPGVVILTVALLLLAGLAGWYFVKNHRAKISPKPLIYRELGWLEGTWGGTQKSEFKTRVFEVNWFWKNDSTLVSDGIVFKADLMDAIFQNQFLQRNDSIFYQEKRNYDSQIWNSYFIPTYSTVSDSVWFLQKNEPVTSEKMFFTHPQKDSFDWYRPLNYPNTFGHLNAKKI